MGVYEDLLKRKKIIEDEQGNVVSNNVVDKNIRRQLNDNNIQTYNIEETKSSINKMKNVIQNTATKTIWDRMQDVIINNKGIKPNNIMDSFRNNMSNSINEELNPTNKNKNIIQDTGSLAKLVGLGASTGGKEVFNYIESANENNFNGYNDLRKRQFLASQNVKEEDKAIAKTQNDLLLNSKGIKVDDTNRVETNLVKKAIRDSINKDNEKIQEEQSKMSNQATKKLAEIAPSMGQMLPGMALNAVNPILGTAYFTTSAGGGYIDDALNRGMNEQQAFKYGTVMGALEGASESIITGQQLSKVKKAFTGKEISKKLLNSYGFNIFENAVQEAVMEPAQEITAGIVGDKADWSNMGSRMLESGFNGALMGAISNGVTFGLEKSGNVYDKIKNGENITETEYKEALQENINKFGKNAVENAMKNGATEVYQEINNLQQQSTQNEQILPTQQINLPTQENVLNQNVNTNNQQNNLEGRSFEDILDDAMSNYEYNEVPSPLQNRDIKTIGKDTKTNAYQYDNPEVKPYFQQMAQMLGEDVGNIASEDNRKTTKGGGISLNTNISAVKQLKEMGYSYNQIIDGIVNIIDDNGKENNALSKKIEILIDEQLRNGYVNSYGKYVNPNEEYINLINDNFPKQNNIVQNENMNQILPTQKYYYKKSDNVKIDNLRQDVNKYFDNSEKTHNFVNMLEKIIEDKDISIRLDENLTDTNGNIANGKYENGTITINPNSDRAGEFIAIHELTHAIGTDSMRNIIENYRKSNTEFDNAVKSLLENYNTTELTDEAMADVSAQLFGNQEYINNLAQENPNLFKRIYNEIKYLWHQFRGYKNQNEFIEDLQYKWEQAYRDNDKLNNTTNYSIQQNENGRYIKVDTDQDIFNGIEEKDYNKIAKMYMQDYLKGNTKLSENDNATIGSKGINKYTNPKQQTKYMAEKMQLTPELKNVLEIAEKVQDSPPTKDTSKYSNWEYYKFNFELGGKPFEGLINIGIDKNGNKHFYEINKIHTTSNSYVSTNKSSSTDSINNSISSTQENVNSSTTNNNSMQESENNSDSFNLSESRKQKQNEIIQENNPMNKELGEHTWINSAEDIKTYQEAIEEFGGIDNITPDFTAEDIKKALNTGEVTVYSSYPIEQGTFVTPSKMEAQSYAGNNQVYSKEVKLNDVAWIDEIQGQYAQIEESKITTMDNKGRKLSKEQQEYFKDSKVRDENGNLLIMYHGTPNGNYNEFNEGTYFTSRKEYADGYQNPNASMLTTKQDSSNPKTYEVYLNIKNPFSIQDERAKRIYLDEYVKGGNSLYLDPYTDYSDYINALDELDWTEGEDLREWLKENHPEYDGLVLDEGGDGGYGEAEYKWRGKSYVPFNSNQIKNVDNLNPTDSPDIRYSKNNQEWQEYLDKNIESKGTKTNLQDIKLPIKKQLLPTNNLANNNVNENTITNNYAQSNENNTQNEQYQATKGESINWNGIERPEGKIRKHYRSIIESSNTTAEAKAIAKEMMGLDTYTPQSNESLLQKADSRISTTNPETELKSLLSRVMNNEKVNDVDMAVGERLIEYYSKIGDSEHLQDAIHATALAGTQAGRTVQAMALLNHMTPQGQVVWLERSVNKANKELEQKFKNKKNIPQFELTSDMTEKILNTKSKEEMYKVLDDVYEELGQQVPKTTLEKIDEWRYFSMLANVKTHGRNMIGNLAMNLTQRAKNKVAGAIEGTVAKFNPEMERTHTIVPTSKKVKDFAKNDVKNMDVQTELGMNENKYNPQSRLQSARRTFKSDVLENTLGKMFDLNSKLLEVEDNIGLKSMYVKSLGEYITANKIDIDNMTDAQLSKARQHAIKEAQEATFHQASALATALNQMGRKNNIAKFALDSAVPFKKTPINVAKTGVQYSPVGLIKSAVYDVGKLRKGDITVNQYIDNVSKGLTGTGIAYLGYVLAEAGILKASGSDDDKKEKYEEEQGKQSYSIEIGGKTYSLDWLSPVGIPLFIGAEINQQFNTSKKEKNSKSNDDNETLNQIVKSVANIANASANAMNPMSEMSMISGLRSVLSSYNKENAVGDMIVNTGKSYINQFVPTALGQLARTTDDYERTTKSTKTGALEKAVDSTINQIKSKIPGLRQTLPTKTDIWGKEVKQSENLPFRAFNNFINPSKVQDVSTDKVDKELNSLYAKTGESSIIPKAIDKTFTIDNTNYRMTNEEYAKYYKIYGNTSYNLIEELINTSDYKSLTDEQKQKAIENVYSYAKEANKLDYAKNNKINVNESTLYKTMNELKDKGGKQSSYINYMASTSGMTKESEKNEVLLNSNYDSKTKSVIYSNGTGKDDKLYNNIKNSNMDINQYLSYKIQESEDKFLADKDSNGKSISGTAKKKIYNYVNTNITGYNNKLLLLGQKYKLTKSEQEGLAKHIYQISSNTEERNELFKYYSKNFTIKNGKVYYK